MSNSFLFAIIPSSNALPDFQTLKVRPFHKSSTISSNHAVSFVPYTKPRWGYWKQCWKWFLGLSLRKAPYKNRCCSNPSLKGKVCLKRLSGFFKYGFGHEIQQAWGYHDLLYTMSCQEKSHCSTECGRSAGWLEAAQQSGTRQARKRAMTNALVLPQVIILTWAIFWAPSFPIPSPHRGGCNAFEMQVRAWFSFV